MQWIIAWLVIVVIAAVVEFWSVQLVAVWFCFGAFAAMVASYFGMEPLWQVILFLCVSIVLVLSTRKFAKRMLTPKLQKTNADRVVGMKCLITSNVDNTRETGSANVLGLEWTARSYDDSITFEKGDRAVVKAISGVKLILSPDNDEMIEES